MTYDFDKIIDRAGSGDLKHGALKERWGRDDLLPLWVADMDFETPHFIAYFLFNTPASRSLAACAFRA